MTFVEIEQFTQKKDKTTCYYLVEAIAPPSEWFKKLWKFCLY